MTGTHEITRIAICERAKQKCELCGKQTLLQDGQLARIVPKHRKIKKLYGNRVIQDIHNIAWVCSLNCNHIVQICENGVYAIALLDAIGREDERRADELRKEILKGKKEKIKTQELMN